MKTTDFSKLHLAKRVYLKGSKQYDVVETFRSGKGEEERISMYLRNDSNNVILEYLPSGEYVNQNKNLDIIAFDIDEPLSEERSAYIEKISRDAMNIVMGQPKLITMQFTVEELKEFKRWYDALDCLDESCLEDKLCEAYTAQAHKLAERISEYLK